MKKLLSLVVVLTLVGLVNAAPVSISDTLTGYTDGSATPGSTEDLQTVQQLAANGLETQVIWGNGDGIPDDVGSLSWERVMFDTTGATFGTGNGGDLGRNTLRTIDTTYNTVSFEAAVTIHNFNANHNLWIGMGTGNRGQFGIPDWDLDGGGADASWTELNGDSIRFFHQNSTAYDVISAGGLTVGGTHRVLFAYDAVAQIASVSVDLDYNGTFAADIVTATLSTSDLWTAGKPARVYFGSDDGAVLTDFNLAVVPEPSTMILLTLGGLLFRRGRK